MKIFKSAALAQSFCFIFPLRSTNASGPTFQTTSNGDYCGYEVEASNFLGCFNDDPDYRALPAYQVGIYESTACVDKCVSKGYDYAGIQHYGECWCGSAKDDYAKYGTSTECNCNALKGENSGKMINCVYKVPTLEYGQRCSDGPTANSQQCKSGLCGDNCSIAQGSCMCPVSETSDGKCLGEYGIFEKGENENCNVCCGLITTDKGHIIESSTEASCNHVATVEGPNEKVAACNKVAEDRNTPDVNFPVCYGSPRGEGSLFAGTLGEAKFAEVCYHWSDCASGICATGCDCPSDDISRVFYPQSCSCQCIKPAVGKGGLTDPGKLTYQTSSCGAFFISYEPEGRFCPPCTIDQCLDYNVTKSLISGKGGWLCTGGESESQMHHFPAHWLTTKRSPTDPGNAPLVAMQTSVVAVTTVEQIMCGVMKILDQV